MESHYHNPGFKQVWPGGGCFEVVAKHGGVSKEPQLCAYTESLVHWKLTKTSSLVSSPPPFDPSIEAERSDPWRPSQWSSFDKEAS